MQLHVLVECSRQVAASRGRKRKVALLAGCLQAAGAARALAATLLAGQTRQGKLGVGPALLRDIQATPPAVRPQLTLTGLDHQLQTLADVRGGGAGRRRRELLAALFGQATGAEQDFLARLLTGELRQGALESLLLDAIASAAAVSVQAVRRARMLAPDLAAVAEAAWHGGERALARFTLHPMLPVQPMLAATAETLDDAFALHATPALEYKLDGARIQVHRQDDQVRIYTRRLNDVTAALPEVAEAVRALPCRSIILDGETLALRDDGRPLPFQVTMRRFGRRLDVDSLRASLPLSSFFFDCLLLDDQPLIDSDNASRVAALHERLPAALHMPRLQTGSRRAAEHFLTGAFEAGHEGVMVKSPAAAYAAGSRGSAWLKLKQAHTLDLVVLAAEWGSGRRRGWLSNLHLGARDGQGGFVMLGKTFKGMTDRLLAWQTGALLARETGRDGNTVHVRPELVVEVAFNDVQESGHYPGGLALRFARVRGYRDDRSATDADSIDSVRALHAASLA